MKNEELLYTLALTRIPGLGLIGACLLYTSDAADE